MRLSVITLFLAAVAILSSCKKDDADPSTAGEESENNSTESNYANSKPHAPIDSCLYSELFQPGTYWIYKNDSSGIEDSVYVVYSTHYDSVQWYGSQMGQTAPDYSDFTEYQFIRLRSDRTGKERSFLVSKQEINIYYSDSLQSNIHLYPPYYTALLYGCWLQHDTLAVGSNAFNEVQSPSSFLVPTGMNYYQKGVGIVVWGASHISALQGENQNIPWSIVRWHVEV